MQNIEKTEVLQDYLSKIKTSGDYLLRLINSVLEMARIEKGNLTLDYEPAELSNILKNTFSMFEEEARKNQIDYRFHIGFDEITANIDQVRVKEILANIVSNAIKYTASGGKVFIETEVKQRTENSIKNHELNVTVQDTGIGMSSDFLPHIFDSFSRERTNFSHQIQGTGLGMGITKKLLDIIADTTHDLPVIFSSVYAYAAATNAKYLSNLTRSAVSEVEFSFNPDDWGEFAVSHGTDYAFFPIAMMDKCILNLVNYGYLFLRNKRLYRLIKKYEKLFGDLYEGAAEQWLNEKIKALYKADPSFEKRHRNYFYYAVVQLYPLAYESYFWQRQTLLSIFYTELLMIFDVTEYESTGKVPDINTQILDLCCFERGTRHNPSMTDNIYNVIRKDFI